MNRTLAFGDDGSAEADECWDWLTSHAWNGWDLEIITADPPADMHPVPPEEAELHPWEPEKPRQADDLFDSVVHLRAEVDPRLALIAKHWDLVAIGPRGSGLLKTLHLGSTADWLLRQPASPLLIAHQPGKVREVLVAADGSAHARRAIDTFVSFPWAADTMIRVVSVDDGQVDVEGALEVASKALADTGAEIETATLRGKATKAILDDIEQADPDLVVMGARGQGGLRRIVVGSTTTAVAGSTHRSLLVAHAFESDAG